MYTNKDEAINAINLDNIKFIEPLTDYEIKTVKEFKFYWRKRLNDRVHVPDNLFDDTPVDILITSIMEIMRKDWALSFMTFLSDRYCANDPDRISDYLNMFHGLHGKLINEHHDYVNTRNYYGGN